jgi:hypothetical protein
MLLIEKVGKIQNFMLLVMGEMFFERGRMQVVDSEYLCADSGIHML